MAMDLRRGLAEAQGRAGHSHQSVHCSVSWIMSQGGGGYLGLCVMCPGMTAESPRMPIGCLGNVISGHCKGL